ncbi:MAG: hypothetical protein ABFS17_14045, partial [Chloroflexota bacterium]
MDEEKKHPDSEQPEQGSEEDAPERFRRLTTQPYQPTSSNAEASPEETLSVERAGPAEDSLSPADSPDQTSGWHGRGHEGLPIDPGTEQELPAISSPENDSSSGFEDNTTVMAAEAGAANLDQQPPASSLEDTKPRAIKPTPSENHDLAAETIPPDTDQPQEVISPESPIQESSSAGFPAAEPSGSPLPTRVTETDLGATQVSQAAVTPTSPQGY